MRKLALVAFTAAAVALVAGTMSVAAPNLYGENGLMEIPDDQTYAVGQATPSYSGIYNSGQSIDFYTVGVGVLPNLSVSGGVAEFPGGSSESVLNAKYRVSPESATRPSITLGVMDAAGNLNMEEDPGFYVLFGKNLTAAAEEVAGTESKPLRGYVGFGTGVLKGVFGGLDWKLTPKFSAMLEYVGSDIGLTGDAHFNGGVRYAVNKNLKVSAGYYDFDYFSASVSYAALKF